ncbi:hypothetical protein [Streptomyces sp. NBC_01304]|uniref:hypothetical protein n=1 Tax=Streptomyces sp. NBC_01304 TaxID=2903818 RepID=UPI002E1373E8|nr:hypothetical protein OG430_06265 [Streptomyces sp. NBC_01304]
MRFHFGLRVVGYRPDLESPLCGQLVESAPEGTYYCGERKVGARCAAHSGQAASPRRRRSAGSGATAA